MRGDVMHSPAGMWVAQSSGDLPRQEEVPCGVTWDPIRSPVG